MRRPSIDSTNCGGFVSFYSVYCMHRAGGRGEAVWQSRKEKSVVFGVFADSFLQIPYSDFFPIENNTVFIRVFLVPLGVSYCGRTKALRCPSTCVLEVVHYCNRYQVLYSITCIITAY